LIGKEPLIILDGAQNLASAGVLKSALKSNFKYRRLILVLGISDDKDISGICRTLNPLADEVILTRALTPRATDPQKLRSYFKRKLYLTHNVKEAKLLARKIAKAEDLILVTGSLFVVGEFRGA
jgi:dihydrofolate synthase/folylpolyglutamate synthase